MAAPVLSMLMALPVVRRAPMKAVAAAVALVGSLPCIARPQLL